MSGLGSAFVNGLGMGLGGAVAILVVILVSAAIGSPLLARTAGA